MTSGQSLQTHPHPPAKPKHKRRKSLYRTIALRMMLLGLSVLVALGVLEVLLRVVGPAPGKPRYGDAALGFIAMPNVTESFVLPEYGGTLTMKTNNMGFHEDEDTTVAANPGTTRILVVGDSQTAGECANRETYPNLLEERLNGADGGRRFEVINAGVGRYSPYQYYVNARRLLPALKPDHLIVGLYIGNDFMDLIRQDDRPYLTRQSDGTVELRRPEFMIYADPESPPRAFALTQTATLARRALGPTFLYQMRRARMLWHTAVSARRSVANAVADIVRYMWEVKAVAGISRGFITQTLLQHVWFHRFPQTLDDALYLNRYVMTLFRELCRQNGVQLTYVILPTKLQIEPEAMQGILRQVAHYQPDYAVDRLRAFEDRLTEQTLSDSAELGITAIDLRPPMLQRGPGMPLYYPEEMHLNPTGNSVIAGILGEAVGKAQ